MVYNTTFIVHNRAWCVHSCCFIRCH